MEMQLIKFAILTVIGSLLLKQCSAYAKAWTECEKRLNCTYCQFHNCQISNFTTHTPSNAANLRSVTFRDVTVNDMAGCIAWFQQLSSISESFWLEHNSAEIGQCLHASGQPLRFADAIYELKLKNLEVNETWLRSTGAHLLSDLRGKKVEELTLQTLRLTSARSIIDGVRVGDQLSLAGNNLVTIESDDLLGYDLTDLNSLELSSNHLCVLRLDAMREADRLKRVQLIGNPLYVPSDIVLKWRAEYSEGALISNDKSCEQSVRGYQACRIVSVNEWHYIRRKQNYTAVVTLVDVNSSPNCVLTRRSEVESNPSSSSTSVTDANANANGDAAAPAEAAAATQSPQSSAEQAKPSNLTTTINSDLLRPTRPTQRPQQAKECVSQAACSLCEFHSCRLSDFTRHRRGESDQIESLNIFRVNLSNTEGCVEWMRELPRITREFRLTRINGVIRECLQRLAQPIRFSTAMSLFRFGNLEGIYESWLREHGALLFGELQIATVELLQLEALALRSTTSPFGPVRVTRELSLWHNEISVIYNDAFDSYDVSAVQTLQLTQNSICAFHLGALRTMVKLRHVGLEDNPLYVPSDVLISWLSEYPEGVLISSAVRCEKIASDYAKFRVVSKTSFEIVTDKSKETFVSLLVPPEKLQIKPRYDTVQSVANQAAGGAASSMRPDVQLQVAIVLATCSAALSQIFN